MLLYPRLESRRRYGLVDAGISYPHLKKAGRWQSDACLIYFRSGVSVARTVARLLSDARARAHKPQEGQVRRGQAP